MTRTCLTFSAVKYGLENISGFCSPIPITGIGSGFLRAASACAACAGAAAASASTTASSRERTPQPSRRTVSSWE